MLRILEPALFLARCPVSLLDFPLVLLLVLLLPLFLLLGNISVSQILSGLSYHLLDLLPC